MSVHACRQTEDPRKPGRCACGAKLIGAERDLAYEREFLNEAAKKADRRYGAGTMGFELYVSRRLRMGQERYGDQWKTVDLAHEICEESWDSAAYAVLEAQKRLAADDDAVAYHTFEIAVHAAAIDFHARMLRSEQ